jgi:hypothetical protein
MEVGLSWLIVEHRASDPFRVFHRHQILPFFLWLAAASPHAAPLIEERQDDTPRLCARAFAVQLFI